MPTGDKPGITAMATEQGPRKRKIHQFVGWSAVGVAVVGGIDLIIHFTLFDGVMELILLFNVAVHWQYLLGPAKEGE
jgi:hypothetical protein